MEQKTGFKELFLRLVAIVGLIAVLILGAWGIILLAFNLVGLFSGKVDLGSLFTSKTPTEEVTTTTPEPTYTAPATTKPAVKPTTTTTSPKPTAVYTAAPQRAPLYGLPDLTVRITSITSLSSVQGRTVVQFVVENAGTNVAQNGWNFNVSLPLNPAYTYQAQGQQALYPGDKIAYTLTYDNNQYGYNQYNYNQPCTLQYPNNCYNQYQYQQPAYDYSYQQTCYTYNGYVNIPGPCPAGTYNPNANYYGNNNTNYNYNYYPYQNGGIVTVNVDPQNWVPEIIEYNNQASKSIY